MHKTFQHYESEPMWIQLPDEYQLDLFMFYDFLKFWRATKRRALAIPCHVLYTISYQTIKQMNRNGLSPFEFYSKHQDSSFK